MVGDATGETEPAPSEYTRCACRQAATYRTDHHLGVDLETGRVVIRSIGIRSIGIEQYFKLRFRVFPII